MAASYGAQQQVNVPVEQAMVTYHHDETARLANGMPQKDLTVTQMKRLPVAFVSSRWTREQLHSFGTAGSRPAIKRLEYPHGTGPVHSSTAG